MEMSKVIIGAMRFKDRQNAVETVRAAIAAGFNYIDASPCYCYQNEQENSERWIGEAVNYKDYRRRVMISAKCSPGNGGWKLGEFDKAKGFGVLKSSQLDEVFEQSKQRMGVDYFDYYHMWTTHTSQQLKEALKPGGWYDGVTARGDQWHKLGITTHADSATIIRFLETGKFSVVTLPLNVINTTRLDVVDYCRRHDITVIAMNPLAGGFLAQDEKLKEYALRYLLSLSGVHALIGFSSPEEVAYAKWISDTNQSYGLTAEEIKKQVSKMLDSQEPRCTACGYCQPCPEGINVGASLSYFNVYKYMNMPQAKEAFIEKQWEDGLRLDRCISCGVCETRCPNRLNVTAIIDEAKELLYGPE